MVGSLNDWQKERQFRVLNDKKEERGVKVIRDGVEKVIDVHEVVVGDVALLEPGEIVPCDGVFISGHNVKCDESGATGESDAIKKVSYEECIRAQRAKGIEGSSGGDNMSHTDCFVVSGSKVLEGYGSYVVIAVGQKSFNGRIMMGTSVHSFCFKFYSFIMFIFDSVARRDRKYASPIKIERLGGVDCQARKCSRPYTFHSPHDSIFCPAWYWRSATHCEPEGHRIHTNFDYFRYTGSGCCTRRSAVLRILMSGYLHDD